MEETLQKAKDLVVTTSQEVTASMGLLGLPLDGYPDPHHHIFVITPYIKERLAHVNLKDAIINTSTFANGGINHSMVDGMQGMQNHMIDPESFDVFQETPVPLPFKFFRKLIRFTGLYTMATNAMTYINSLHFFGVQPQPFKGFTCYRNKNLDSNEESQMHYPLSPTEFLLYGMNVKSCTDGVVTEVRMDQDDKLRGKPRVEFTRWKVDEHLGNLIRIKKGFVEFTYAGLMRNSAKVKVGDKVLKGQEIGRVGCSAWSQIPFLYLQFSLIGARLRGFGNAAPAFRHCNFKWDGFLESRLLKLPVYDKMKDHTDIFREVDPQSIKYEYSNLIKDGSLIKPFRVMALPHNI